MSAPTIHSSISRRQPSSEYTLENSDDLIEDNANAAPIMNILFYRGKTMIRSTSTSSIESLSNLSDITLPDSLACHKHESHMRFDTSPCRSDAAPQRPCRGGSFPSLPKHLDLSPRKPERQIRRMRSPAGGKQGEQKTIRKTVIAIFSPSKHTSSAALKAMEDLDETDSRRSSPDTRPSFPWKNHKIASLAC
jgi:hypothetical protein